ncbi:helix-turn-helix transcriptional regulator [Mesorhizobium huakuii]|uniref:Autoinducer-binding protein n=1 Tax=Mesorhizobium huakuii TaxID=28104 RepID=A0A7G6T4W6_9HYPH|nr:LuxR family transcriptional regulator [Mesorhizobium huakuii]QND61798.1 autoinducer-binding protein [Mesorhizobium huakuii]QND69239.1 autoinducer-binding protein [Mesorhizobium loti]
MEDTDAFDFIERCESHRRSKSLLDDLLSTVKVLGFDHLIFSGVPVDSRKLASMVELNGWPVAWFERYVSANHAAVDGVSIFAARTLKPFFWADIPERFSATKQSSAVQGEAREFGMRSGFAVPMLSLHHGRSVMSFASPGNRCDISDRQKKRLVAMAMYAGQSLAEKDDEPPHGPTITQREKEMLYWAALGKSAWEISEILGLAERTVEWHLQSTRKKFGVAKTIQAIVEAIRRGIIHP